MAGIYPVGVKDFKTLVTDGYRYVDKTIMIADICRRPGCTTVFSRPRGFGKTLTLSMLDRFFNIRYKDEGDIFAGTEISGCRECDKYRNRLPVIRLDLSGIDGCSPESTMEGLKSAVADMVRDFRGYGLESELTDSERNRIDDLENKKAAYNGVMGAVDDISEILERFCGEMPVILVDGYDDCILSSPDLDGFGETAEILGRFMMASLKVNDHFKFVVVMGVTAPKTSGVSRYLTAYDCGIFDSRCRDAFGFTEEEVIGLLEGAEDIADRMAEIRGRHGGYIFDDTELFSPAGVIRFLDGGCGDKGLPYDAIPKWLMSCIDSETSIALKDLAEGRIQSIESAIDDNCIPDVFGTGLVPSKAYMHLVMSGCLRAVCLGKDDRWRDVCRLSVTNSDAGRLFTELTDHAEGVLNGASGE